MAAEFFEGDHNVVLGGSWATHPQLAGRKSLSVSDTNLELLLLIKTSVNFFQTGYKYAWIGARVVKDL